MEKKVIREIFLGIVLLLCAVLVLFELNSNLLTKEYNKKFSLIPYEEVDSLKRDSLLPTEEIWDESDPDFLRQEY